jgi:hypothetical protein
MATGLVKWCRARFLAGYKPFSGNILKPTIFFLISFFFLLFTSFKTYDRVYEIRIMYYISASYTPGYNVYWARMECIM